MPYLKNKIINDPIYGFIHIPFNIILSILDHPYFQRLRRISQLGLSSLVYPGANHNRFHHAIGSMHLMNKSIEVLRSKGHEISVQEHKAACIAILLHDIGHGPFSHALENTIVDNLTHEEISIMFMQKLNEEFDNKLSLAIEIFQNKYHKTFLHQLISSQLDVDRLDYLNRDSFYSGVNEGIINSQRIISMFNVKDQDLVVDFKGIYSIEKFIIARKLMYWQVYLHKTVLSAEHTLMKILLRAKELCQSGEKIFTTPEFKIFLYEKNAINANFFKSRKLLNLFARLDDSDLITCIKNWAHDKDEILNYLSNCILNRKLLKIKSIKKHEIEPSLKIIREKIQTSLKVSHNKTSYLVFAISIKKETYSLIENEIKFLKTNQELINLSDVQGDFNMTSRNSEIIKHYICYPDGYLN
ncbi:MAG: phosphohydrolase [Flavobacteriales bacterium]|nr:phosphohydrolase [Flavobacteriales bacterium]|tara:strand:- start:6273 stop:7511 length:1239 start_codon:yes stop_codon:yes gene_type:complete